MYRGAVVEDAMKLVWTKHSILRGLLGCLIHLPPTKIIDPKKTIDLFTSSIVGPGHQITRHG